VGCQLGSRARGFPDLDSTAGCCQVAEVAEAVGTWGPGEHILRDDVDVSAFGERGDV
jgi:hypothetical protein